MSKKKNKNKGERDYDVLASIIVLLLGLFLITLFIFLVGEKVNEEAIKPGKVIYNNPGFNNGNHEEELEFEIIEIEEDVETDESDSSISITEETINDVQGISQTTNQGNWWSYPTVINVIPANQVTLTTIVDKGNRLDDRYIPNVVSETIATLNNSTVVLTPETIFALKRLAEAAQTDGVNDLVIVSSFRDFVTQRNTYNYWVSYNGGNIDAADKISARPGHSEHQLGTVVDFATIGTRGNFAAFESTRAYSWLKANADKFGFRQSYPAGMETVTGYSAESWHWRYWGE